MLHTCLQGFQSSRCRLTGKGCSEILTAANWQLRSYHREMVPASISFRASCKGGCPQFASNLQVRPCTQLNRRPQINSAAEELLQVAGSSITAQCTERTAPVPAAAPAAVSYASQQVPPATADPLQLQVAAAPAPPPPPPPLRITCGCEEEVQQQHHSMQASTRHNVCGCCCCCTRL